MYKLFTTALILSLISCFGKKQTDIERILPSDSEEYKEYINRNCHKHTFSQGSADNLYGLDCIADKQLKIKTSSSGSLVSTSKMADISGLNLEKDLSFKNKFYSVQYKILEGQGDDKTIPFLLKFFPQDEKLKGDLDTQYHIIFKLLGNYLVLFKASENLNKLPFTERTSLKVFSDGKMKDYDSQNTDKIDYYAVPIIGYPIKYCNAETIINDMGERTYENRPNCSDNFMQNANYIQVDKEAKQTYNYMEELKKDLFPSDYFDRLWFFSTGDIETLSSEAEVAPTRAYLVKMEKQLNHLNLVNMSGDVEDRSRRILGKIPVEWLDFEMDQKGNNQFETFGEKTNISIDPINRSYVRISFPEDINVTSLTIKPNYLSYTGNRTDEKTFTNIKTKTSFLRTTAVDSKNFVSKRWWYQPNQEKVFGIMPIFPQTQRKRNEFTEEDSNKHARMIRFNISLNSVAEKRTQTKIINWYFSNNSTKDSDYRAVAQKAIQIYNEAFAYLTKNSDKKVKIQLNTNEEKDLGDLRYNIINLVKAEDLIGSATVLGRAPSYVNPNTGQIIGTTANIFIHITETIYDQAVKDYIRYEVHQKHKKTDEENIIHAVSQYIRVQITKQCPEVTKRIAKIKKTYPTKASTPLNDKDVIISCGKKLTNHALLSLILHELGHSFGLSHNFKASTDEDNFYKSKDEIKKIFPNITDEDIETEIASYSSVMDYPSFQYPSMRYLGKYDLAVLRYLYFDKMEKKDGGLFSLDIPADPAKQTALTKETLNNRKQYKHCSDIKPEDSPNIQMCYMFDYGSNPRQIAENDFIRLKRLFNNRYRYDLNEDKFKRVNLIANNNLSYGLSLNIVQGLLNSIHLYSKWISLRNNYLQSISQLDKTTYILNDDSALTSYQDILKQNLNNAEYKLYYEMRDMLPKMLMYLINLEDMKCYVINKKDTLQTTHRLPLEHVKNYLRDKYTKNLYAADCYSPQVLDFFKKHNLALIKQSGYENFKSYSPMADSPTWDVIPIQSILHPLKNDEGQNLSFIYDTTIIFPRLLDWVNEPDFLHQLVITSQNNYLDTKKNKTFFARLKNIIVRVSALKSVELTLLNQPTIYAQHSNNIQVKSFRLGTSINSFYQRVTVVINKDPINGINKINIPFLTEAYNEYKAKREDVDIFHLDFLGYLKTKKDVYYNNEKIFIPFESNSFAGKIISNYNKVLKTIEDLENKENLSILEEFYKTGLKEYIKIFQNFNK